MYNLRYKAKILTGILVTLVLMLAVPVSVYLLQNATSFFLTARGEPANLVVDLSTSKVVSSGLWRNFAQGGEGDRADLPKIVSQMSELEADYIRIDHLFNRYNTVKLENGKLVFDWTGVDAEVDAILAAGAKPFLSLSYFPPSITRSGSDIDLPQDWNHWQEIVRETVQRYSGTKNISGIYYEVWNEPDLFGDFKTYGEKNYLELYRYAAQGAIEAQNVNSYKIGGPAITAAYPNWFNELMKFTSENNLPLDFLSWHRYTYNLDDYEEDVKIAEDAIANFPQYSNIELIVSELGPNSVNDASYDTNVGAIHALASLSVLDQKVDRAFTFELQDGKGEEKYWGRWGMLTHGDYPPVEKKPRFSAFLFLNSMFGRHVDVSGMGTWVKAMARYDGETLRILVSNFDGENKHFETVPITVTNLENGEWVYRRIDFLGNTRENNLNIENGTHSVSELFSPNSAAILELEPAN